MKSVGVLILSLVFCLSISAQTTPAPAASPDTNTGTKKKAAIFRATKEQIKQAQTILKERNLFTGEANGKMDDPTRRGMEKYQLAEGLKITGTLNQPTVEKMNIPLTDSQKGIRKPDISTPGEKKSAVFRASKEQITQAQALLKEKGFYRGEATGKLDEDTREAVRKYQATNGIKVTGTLNRETLGQMGVQLTEKQKTL
jgi:peptidoglycan hydrolase-like protein with peptidoglycan-binding domain